MIKVSIVSYLNTIPLQYGLQQSDEFNSIAKLTKDIPAECARKLINKEVDVGLIPVAAIPLVNKAGIVSDYCISANGDVDSVLLVSDVDLSEIKIILLDYQSKTSIRLMQLLAKQFWNIQPEWLAAQKGFENEIKGTVAAVVIGDRTFDPQIQKFAYRYDLSKAWLDFTGKPFVFACWVSNNDAITQNKQFIEALNNAQKYGVEHINRAINCIYDENKGHLSKKRLHHYLTKKINYNFDSSKQDAMKLFFKYINAVAPY